MKTEWIQNTIDALRGKKKRTSQVMKEHRNPLTRQVSASEAAHTYYVEVLSSCNLKCSLCAFGSSELFQRKHGKMSLEMFEEILKKIKRESPNATVSPYHHCEPLLHPELPEMVALIKRYGFKCSTSFNFNIINRLEDLLKSQPDIIEISVSGFFQETYGNPPEKK